MNSNAQIPVHILAFSSFGYLPKSGIGRSYGDSMFDFLRNYHSISYRGYTFYIPIKIYKFSNFSISSPICVRNI